jgi:hypothetical protein
MANRFSTFYEGKKETDRAFAKLDRHLVKCGLNDKQIAKVSKIVGDIVDCEVEIEKFCNG